jgi:hypothetical protein
MDILNSNLLLQSNVAPMLGGKLSEATPVQNLLNPRSKVSGT